LLGSLWVAEDIGGTGVIDNLQSRLQFVSASQVAGHGGCNSFAGAAVLSADQLSMGPLASTRKMCPPAVMDQENRFLRTLETVRSARVENELLYLQDAGGHTVVRLSRRQ
jgi:heat shock protein HslJ